MSRPVRGLLAPENRAVSLAVTASMALAFYNATSVTAALPEIGADLGRVALTQWVITVELLAAAIAVLAIGPFIDGSGVRRAYRFAVIGFAAASALCAAAPTMEVLVGARLVQGLATGSLIGTAMTCIGLAYAPDLRPRAYAMVASVWGVMGVGGPAVAAALVSTLGWRSVFAVNLPVAAVAAIAAWNRVPAEAQARAEPLDRRGLALMGAIAVALLLATSSLQWSSIALMVLAVALYALYVRHARRRPGPIVHISHITGRQWWPVHVVAIASIAGGTGASVFLPLYLKGARGTSLSFAAFAVLWPTVGWAVASWVSSKLQERMRAQSVVVIGSFILTAGAAAITVAAATAAPHALLFAAFVLLGWGIGTITPSSMALLQNRADSAEMGRVTSAHQFIRSLGWAYGAALAGMVLFWVVERRAGDVEAVRALLDDSDAGLDTALAATLSSAYAWSLGALGVISALTVPAALGLYRSYNPDRITRD